jgi:uncharacterized protein YbjT (DUF2867 family)
MEKTILVIGGTGMLGQPVARSLNEAGFGVRIMTRDRQKAQQLFDDSFEIVAGDPADTCRLEEALDGCYGVHISLPTAVEQQVAEMVAKVAAGHSVERISYISGATVAEEHRWFPDINRKFLAEQAIRASSIPYTIFCPTWFMESLPLFVMQGRASVLGKQPCPYHWVAAADYAQMVAKAYGLATAANRRFIVHGPEAIRMYEALQRYCAVFHPDITQVSTMPLWLVKLLATITRNHELQTAGELMAYFDRVGEGSNRPDANDVLGAPATTLVSWLERRKARLSAAGAEALGRPPAYV